MQTNIKIEDVNEERLLFINKIAVINGVDTANKEKLINFSIKIAAELVEALDEESLEQIINLKKSL